MEKYIQQYLSESYYISTSDVGNDGLYKLKDNRRHKPPITSKTVIDELITVFGLVEEEAKRYIQVWGLTQKPDLDLEFYWKTYEDLFQNAFPLVRAVATHTLAMELVPVQPISLPKMDLMCLDVFYKKPTLFERIFGSLKKLMYLCKKKN